MFSPLFSRLLVAYGKIPAMVADAAKSGARSAAWDFLVPEAAANNDGGGINDIPELGTGIFFAYLLSFSQAVEDNGMILPNDDKHQLLRSPSVANRGSGRVIWERHVPMTYTVVHEIAAVVPPAATVVYYEPPELGDVMRPPKDAPGKMMTPADHNDASTSDPSGISASSGDGMVPWNGTIPDGDCRFAVLGCSGDKIEVWKAANRSTGWVSVPKFAKTRGLGDKPFFIGNACYSIVGYYDGGFLAKNTVSGTERSLSVVEYVAAVHGITMPSREKLQRLVESCGWGEKTAKKKELVDNLKKMAARQTAKEKELVDQATLQKMAARQRFANKMLGRSMAIERKYTGQLNQFRVERFFAKKFASQLPLVGLAVVADWLEDKNANAANVRRLLGVFESRKNESIDAVKRLHAWMHDNHVVFWVDQEERRLELEIQDINDELEAKKSIVSTRTFARDNLGGEDLPELFLNSVLSQRAE